MKKYLFIFSLIAFQLHAQNNTFPTPSGNVGIGTLTPSDKLEVVGDITLSAYNATNDGPLKALKFFNSYPSSNSVLAQIQARRGIGSFQKGDLAFYVKNGTSLIEALRIVSSSYVGIGTKTPASLLDIRTSDNKGIWLNYNNESAITFKPNNGNSIFHLSHGHDNKLHLSQGTTVGAGKIMTFVNTGNVAIGTTLHQVNYMFLIMEIKMG